MSPPRPSPAKFSETRGFASMLRWRAPGWLNMITSSPPSQWNHTGLGSGLPFGVTVVIQIAMSSRRWAATARAEVGALVDLDHLASRHCDELAQRPEVVAGAGCR